MRINHGHELSNNVHFQTSSKHDRNNSDCLIKTSVLTCLIAVSSYTPSMNNHTIPVSTQCLHLINQLSDSCLNIISSDKLVYKPTGLLGFTYSTIQ